MREVGGVAHGDGGAPHEVTPHVRRAADGPGGDGGEAPVTAISTAVWSHIRPGSRVRPPPEQDICAAALQLEGITYVK